MSPIREVHWANAKELPSSCAWCGAFLRGGEVFVFEVGAEALASGEVTLVEFDTLHGFNDLHAACRNCRQSIVDDEFGVENKPEDRDRNFHNDISRRWAKRALLLGGFYIFVNAAVDFGGFWVPLFRFSKYIIWCIFMFWVIKTTVEYLRNKLGV